MGLLTETAHPKLKVAGAVFEQFDYKNRANSVLPNEILVALQDFPKARLELQSKITGNRISLEVADAFEASTWVYHRAQKDEAGDKANARLLRFVELGGNDPLYFSAKNGQRYDPSTQLERETCRLLPFRN